MSLLALASRGQRGRLAGSSFAILESRWWPGRTRVSPDAGYRQNSRENELAGKGWGLAAIAQAPDGNWSVMEEKTPAG
jgi:hypothetical protein